MSENDIKTSQDASIPELSVVVLCYRAEESIIPFIEKMEKELNDDKINYELVLVANYIPNIKDKTPEIVRQLAKNNSKIIPVIKEKEGMMGWDLHSGLRVARGKSIAFIDGDGQMPSFDIIRLHRVFKSWEFDLCKTYRIKRYDPFWRQAISVIFNFLFNVLFPGVYIHDINSKPKIISREAYNKMNLKCDDWFADGEMMVEARYLKLVIGEIPTVFYENRWRKTFVKPMTILEFIKNMIIYRFKYWLAPRQSQRKITSAKE